MKMNKLLAVLVLVPLAACRDYTPKPYAYPRIDFPEKDYNTTKTTCPFTFEAPAYSSLVPVPDAEYDCWYDLKYLPFNATLHLSYRPFENQRALDSLTEDAYKMAFDHISRAEEIIEREVYDTVNGMYGMIYDLEGKTATPFNFYLTDRKQHFFRGSFYFNVQTNRDSVAPIYDYLREDIMHSIKTFQWTTSELE